MAMIAMSTIIATRLMTVLRLTKESTVSLLPAPMVLLTSVFAAAPSAVDGMVMMVYKLLMILVTASEC